MAEHSFASSLFCTIASLFLHYLLCLHRYRYPATSGIPNWCHHWHSSRWSFGHSGSSDDPHLCGHLSIPCQSSWLLPNLWRQSLWTSNNATLQCFPAFHFFSNRGAIWCKNGDEGEWVLRLVKFLDLFVLMSTVVDMYYSIMENIRTSILSCNFFVQSFRSPMIF